MSITRTSLLAIICLSRIPAATTLGHPLYFEERSSGLFEARAAGQSVKIYADRIELDGVTLRFVHPSSAARLEGIGTPAASTYITRGSTRSFRHIQKPASETSTRESMRCSTEVRNKWNTIWISPPGQRRTASELI